MACSGTPGRSFAIIPGAHLPHIQAAGPRRGLIQDLGFTAWIGRPRKGVLRDARAEEARAGRLGTEG